MEKVILPDSLIYIGPLAFSSYVMNTIKHIDFGNGVKVIGNGAIEIEYKNKLEVIELPQSLESIHGSIIKNNNYPIALDKLVVPNSLKSFSGAIFDGIPPKVKIECPEGVMNALKKYGTGKSKFFARKDESDEFVPIKKPNVSVSKMIEKYGIANDGFDEGREFFDHIDAIDMTRKNVCLAGGIYDEPKLVGFLEKNGFKTSQSISKRTDYLIINKDVASHRTLYNSVRYRKAFGKLLIVDYKEFLALI